MLDAVTFKYYAHIDYFYMCEKFCVAHLRNAESCPDEEKTTLRPLLSENSESVSIQHAHGIFIPSWLLINELPIA